jgi:hypothetical protein
MKQVQLCTAVVIVWSVLLAASRATAQTTTAAGPYYATPSWDQKLPSSTRFIVLSNWNGDAVLDRETGLVWQKAPDTDQAPWETAVAFCGRRG